jgi:hypothetical protein
MKYFKEHSVTAHKIKHKEHHPPKIANIQATINWDTPPNIKQRH